MRFSLAVVATAALVMSGSAAPHHKRDSGVALAAAPKGVVARADVSVSLGMRALKAVGLRRDEEEEKEEEESEGEDKEEQEKEENKDEDKDEGEEGESGDKEEGEGDEEAPESGDEADAGEGEDESSSGSEGSAPSGNTGGFSNTTTPTTPTTPVTGNGTAASGIWPQAAGESTLSEPMEVTDFDGGNVRFGRGVSCTEGEGGESDAVFIVADGGSLSNVIIGADQIEGVHCAGACTITNVWWEAVCEDALSFKGDGDGTVVGGGAKGAKDKVVQHNGVGTISISGFQVEDFGKLYRSCGNCKTQGERHVKIDSVTASGGSATLVGINSNFGDTATITNSCITNTDVICQEFEGTSPGNEPEKISDGPSASCIYTEADISAC